MKTRLDPFGNVLPDRMHYKNRAYYHVTTVGGKTRWRKLDASYHTAIRMWSRLESPGQAHTVSQMIEAYLIERHSELAEKTLQGYAESTKNINDEFGACYLDEIEAIDVRRWLHGRKARYSANNDLALLRAAYNYAIEMGWCNANPAQVRRLKVSPRRRTATPEELAKISEVAPPIWRALIAAYVLTGARVSELRTLRRDQLTEEGIELHRSKVDKQSTILWSSALREAIEQAKQAQSVESVYVFPSRKGGPYTLNGLQAMWSRFCKKAGVEGLQLRDLRRTAATKAATLEQASALLGHSSTAITARVYRVRDRVKPTE